MASGPPAKSPDVAGRRKRLIALCEALPEALAERAGVQHLAFKVGKKIFAYLRLRPSRRRTYRVVVQSAAG